MAATIKLIAREDIDVVNELSSTVKKICPYKNKSQFPNYKSIIKHVDFFQEMKVIMRISIQSER